MGEGTSGTSPVTLEVLGLHQFVLPSHPWNRDEPEYSTGFPDASGATQGTTLGSLVINSSQGHGHPPEILFREQFSEISHRA